MKKFAVLLIASLASCTHDSVAPAPESVQTNFSPETIHLGEEGPEKAVPILFSKETPGSGTIGISISSGLAAYGVHFTTIPQAVNGKILLKAETGMEKVELTVITINNTTIDGPIEVDLTIESTEGPLKKGDLLTQKLVISDDEAEGASKGYITTWENWKYKRFFSYTPDGRIARIYWEQQTPYPLSGHYDYYYRENGQLEKMSSPDLSETRYFYENDRIVKEEEYRHGVLTRFADYGYDPAGNVASARIYQRTPSGEIAPVSLIEYLYFSDGNLYRQLTYLPGSSGNPVLLSARTYENYLAAENPFPLEILPNISAQPMLPGSYTLEENGTTLQYNFTYEFDSEGKPVKRITSSSTGPEVSVYRYF